MREDLARLGEEVDEDGAGRFLDEGEGVTLRFLRLEEGRTKGERVEERRVVDVEEDWKEESGRMVVDGDGEEESRAPITRAAFTALTHWMRLDAGQDEIVDSPYAIS